MTGGAAVADSGWLYANTALLATAAGEIGAQKPTVVRTQSTMSSTSLPADAFGQLSESAGAAEQHGRHVREAQAALDQAGRDLDHLVTRLQSRQQQYERAATEAANRLLGLRSRRRPPMSVPQPPMTPWPRRDTPPMTPIR
jgi:hypothetical protein